MNAKIHHKQRTRSATALHSYVGIGGNVEKQERKSCQKLQLVAAFLIKQGTPRRRVISEAASVWRFGHSSQMGARQQEFESGCVLLL